MSKSISIDLNGSKTDTCGCKENWGCTKLCFQSIKNSDIIEDARKAGTCFSPHIYNDGNDIEYLIEVINKACKFDGGYLICLKITLTGII